MHCATRFKWRRIGWHAVTCLALEPVPAGILQFVVARHRAAYVAVTTMSEEVVVLGRLRCRDVGVGECEDVRGRTPVLVKDTCRLSGLRAALVTPTVRRLWWRRRRRRRWGNIGRWRRWRWRWRVRQPLSGIGRRRRCWRLTQARIGVGVGRAVGGWAGPRLRKLVRVCGRLAAVIGAGAHLRACFDGAEVGGVGWVGADLKADRCVTGCRSHGRVRVCQPPRVLRPAASPTRWGGWQSHASVAIEVDPLRIGEVGDAVERLSLVAIARVVIIHLSVRVVHGSPVCINLHRGTARLWAIRVAQLGWQRRWRRDGRRRRRRRRARQLSPAAGVWRIHGRLRGVARLQQQQQQQGVQHLAQHLAQAARERERRGERTTYAHQERKFLGSLR